VRDVWEPDELIGAWTLVEGDWKLIGNKTGATRLGFSLILKFYELEGRFPAYPEEVPQAAVEYLASLVGSGSPPPGFPHVRFHRWGPSSARRARLESRRAR
jgi:hypothetical protein